MLSGDNGILKQAGNAKTQTDIAEEKEQVELAYLSAAVKKLGDDIDKDDLQAELNSSVGINKTLVTGESTFNVYFNDTDHNYNVNGGIVTRVEDGERIEIAPITAIGGEFDYNVTGISTKWELFYYDETKKDIYIIAETTTENTNFTNISKYKGTADYTDLTNFPAIEKGLLSETYNNGEIVKELKKTNMKCVNYMLDKTNWSKYVEKGTKADWAIGGTTLELLCMSYKMKNPSATNWPTVANSNGYNDAGFTSTTKLLTKETVWNHGFDYWLASPASYRENCVRTVGADNCGVFSLIYLTAYGFRPVVHLSGNLTAKKLNDTIVYSVE